MYNLNFFLVKVLFIKRQIKALKMLSPKTWCTKNPFGYRIAHHGYILSFLQDKVCKDMLPYLTQTQTTNLGKY